MRFVVLPRANNCQPTNKQSQKDMPRKDLCKMRCNEHQAYTHQDNCFSNKHKKCNMSLACEDKHNHMPKDHHPDQQLKRLVPTLQIRS